MIVNKDRTVLVGDTTYSLEAFLAAVGQALIDLGTSGTLHPAEPIEVQAIRDQARITTAWRVESLTYAQLLERKAAFRAKYPTQLWFLVDFIPS